MRSGLYGCDGRLEQLWPLPSSVFIWTNLSSWVCCCFFSLQLLLWLPFRAWDGHQGARKRSWQLTWGRHCCISRAAGKKQVAILYLSNEGTEGLGLLKGPFNSSCPSKWHRVGSVSWVLMLSCHTLQTDPSPKAWAVSPCMPNTSNNHTQTANPLQHFVLITTISHLSSNSTRTLTLPMPLKAKRAIHINLILVTLAGS